MTAVGNILPALTCHTSVLRLLLRTGARDSAMRGVLLKAAAARSRESSSVRGIIPNLCYARTPEEGLAVCCSGAPAAAQRG